MVSGKVWHKVPVVLNQVFEVISGRKKGSYVWSFQRKSEIFGAIRSFHKTCQPYQPEYGA